MLDDPATIAELAERLYGADDVPKAIMIERAREQVSAGAMSPVQAAKWARTTPRIIEQAILSADPLSQVFGIEVGAVDDSVLSRARSILGQLVVGSLAERVFEALYRDSVGTSELELRDDRSTRGDTDYFVFNGGGRQMFRLNIKFFGSVFRKAEELVGLASDDCFALATYKICSALTKHEKEVLPYIFAIVGVPDLTGAIVGSEIPDDLVRLAVLAANSPKLPKRDIEDRVSQALVGRPAEFGFSEPHKRFMGLPADAPWYILSARRADMLLREKFFERAYALRVRGFARNYRGAELDMHFLLRNDLTPIESFLEDLASGVSWELFGKLERGLI